MKRIHYLLCLAAAATIGLGGCSTDDLTEGPSQANDFVLTISPDDHVAGTYSTRTEYDPSTGNIVWKTGDQMRLFIDTYGQTSTAVIGADGKASFKAYLSSIDQPQTLTLQGAVPASAVLGVKATDAVAKRVSILQMALPNEQAATLTSFDPAADILIAENMSVAITAEDIAACNKDIADFRFGRPMAITQYTFTLDNPALSADELVESATLTVNAGSGKAEKGLTGRFYFAPNSGYFVDNTGHIVDSKVNPFYQGQSLNNVKVTFAEQPRLGDLVMWAVTAPVKLEIGDQMVFTVQTNVNKIVKTITVSTELQLVNTQLNTAGVKLNAKNCVVTPNEVPGELSETLTYSDLPSTSGYTSSVTTLASGWSIYHYMFSTSATTKGWIQTRYQPGTEANRSYIVSPQINGTITQVNVFCQGAANGMIRLLDADTEAVIASQSVPTATNGGELVFGDLIGNNLSKVKIQVYSSNTNNATVYIQTIKLTYDPSQTPKVIVPAGTKIELSATDTEMGTFAYSLRNATDADVTVSVPSTDDWLMADKSTTTANTVEYMADTNSGAERSTTITLSVAGGNTVEIPVTQYAPVQKLPTPADLTVAADGTTVTASWSTVANASGYSWRVATAAAPTTDVDAGTVDGTSVIIPGLEPNTAYIVSVKALGDNGATYDDSDEATANVTTGESSGITPGPAWSYSFLNTTQVFGTGKTGGTGTLNGYAWTAAYTWAAGSGYIAYEAANGLHIGSGSNAPKTITFSTTAYTEGVSSVSLSARDSNSSTASVTVTVGGTPLTINNDTSAKLTSGVAKYTFEAGSPLQGEIVVLIDRGTTSAKKAIYVTELGIN